LIKDICDINYTTFKKVASHSMWILNMYDYSDATAQKACDSFGEGFSGVISLMIFKLTYLRRVTGDDTAADMLLAGPETNRRRNGADL
jgi:hypothetical protein